MGSEDDAVSGVRRSEDMSEQQWRAALATLPPSTRARAELLLAAYGRLYERHRRVVRRRRALDSALERVPLALMLLDGDRLLWANASAEAHLASGGPFARRGDELRAEHDAVARALEEAREGRPRAAVCVEVHGRRWQLTCFASEIGGPVLVAFAVGDGPALTPRSDELRALFGLTTREARVAILLLAGHTGREIAQELDVGFETARSHVKHVLRKMGCPRQAAAVLALATSPASVGPDAAKVAPGD